MIIELTNLHAKVVKGKPDEFEWLDDYLAFPDKNAFFRRSKFKRDNKIHMLSEHTGAFPAGFIAAVQKQAIADKIKVELFDRRVVPAKAEANPLIDWLRDYQLSAVNVARTTPRGIFHHATGSGKTEIAAGIFELYSVKWLFLTHRKDLVWQTAERILRRTGEVVGTIGDGVFDPKRITIATFQSIFAGRKVKKIREFLLSVQGVMIDEVHVAAASTFYKVAMALPNAYYRYGFSGTPFARGDKKSLLVWGCVGPIIDRMSAQVLIDRGILAKPRIRMLTVRHMAIQRTWAEAYAVNVVQSVKRNSAVLAAVQRATKPAMLFVKDIKHGKILEQAIRSKGHTVEFVWGAATTPRRKAALERLALGETDVMICNVIFQEGIDVPELQSVIIAQGGKSVIAALQRIGRGMRTKNRAGEVTKTEFEVFDIRDRGCGCRTPNKHLGCRWLEKHARGRIAAYASEKFEVIEEQNIVPQKRAINAAIVIAGVK